MFLFKMGAFDVIVYILCLFCNNFCALIFVGCTRNRIQEVCQQIMHPPSTVAKMRGTRDPHPSVMIRLAQKNPHPPLQT